MCLPGDIPEETVQRVDQHAIIHKSNFVLRQNPEGQELRVAPDDLHSPQQFGLFFLKLPQHPDGLADMVHRELGSVLAHHIEQLVFGRANLQLLQDRVSVRGSPVEEPPKGGRHTADPKHPGGHRLE